MWTSVSKSTRRHPRLVIAGLVIGGFLCAWIGFDLIKSRTAEERYRAAVAEADRMDPTWREGKSSAEGELIPDDQNSAALVISSFEKIPQGWQARKGAWPPHELDPRQPLAAELLNELKLVRELANDGLADARALAHKPRGRFTQWRVEVPRRVPTSRQRVDTVYQLLYLDAWIRIEERDLTGAAVDIKGIVNAGRALDDEPMLAVQLGRANAVDAAVAALERLLARGELPGPVLADLQKLLEDEARHRMALVSYRGDRAAVWKLFEDVRNGRAGVASLFDSPRSTLPAMIYSWRAVRENQTQLLEESTRLVEIARRPAEEQGPALQKYRDDLDQQWADAGLAKRIHTYPFHENFQMLAYAGGAQSRHHTAAYLAVLALASERFRLDHGRWPRSPFELIPAYLAAVPYDPYAGGPLHWKQTAKRLIFYSAGMDGRDDGGVWSRNVARGFGKDIGFTLEDPKDRGRPSGSNP
jgi:hypothetical protein